MNADGFTSTGQHLGENMYTYCRNNPVMMIDPGGDYWVGVSPTGKVYDNITMGEKYDIDRSGAKGWKFYTPGEYFPEIKSNMRQKDFVKAVHKRAKAAETRTKIPAAIMTAQACLESGYGTNKLAKEKNNIFSIRIGNVWQSYKDMEESCEGYEKLITKGSRYKGLFQLKTTEQWAYAIGPAGYTPDPGYGEAIIEVIQNWDLE